MTYFDNTLMNQLGVEDPLLPSCYYTGAPHFIVWGKEWQMADQVKGKKGAKDLLVHKCREIKHKFLHEPFDRLGEMERDIEYETARDRDIMIFFKKEIDVNSKMPKLSFTVLYQEHYGQQELHERTFQIPWKGKTMRDEYLFLKAAVCRNGFTVFVGYNRDRFSSFQCHYYSFDRFDKESLWKKRQQKREGECLASSGAKRVRLEDE